MDSGVNGTLISSPAVEEGDFSCDRSGERGSQNKLAVSRPVLKWAGGKHQLLSHLLPFVPRHFNRYIEPFVGGGALFFALQPGNAVISDANAELINVYQVLAQDVEMLIEILCEYRVDKEEYYQVRGLDFHDLSPINAAARTLYLNRLCYNGLYRVNRQGKFNVPYGSYKSPRICDTTVLRCAAAALRGTTILAGDFKDILHRFAQPGDFIYIDPPYLPCGQYADFKRYTTHQFQEADHTALAVEVHRLHEMDCYVLMTQSNHPLIYEFYRDFFCCFDIKVVPSRRNINNQGDNRQGEDVIIYLPPQSAR